MNNVVHVRLGSGEFGFFRTGGCGLANCMFFVARGLIYAKKNNMTFLRPTWERFGVGPILRREKDKRFYLGLFKDWLSWATVYKCIRLFIRKDVIVLSGWWNYFAEMPDYWEDITDYFNRNISKSALRFVPKEITNSIALHIRLGDMTGADRIPVDWSLRVLNLVRTIVPNANVLLFSDGKDEELVEVLKLPNVKRVSFGNALADIVAISKCQMVIGTYSTFSWWGAYLSQAPYIANSFRNSGCCHKDKSKFCEIGDVGDLPESFKNHIRCAFDRG